MTKTKVCIRDMEGNTLAKLEIDGEYQPYELLPFDTEEGIVVTIISVKDRSND